MSAIRKFNIVLCLALIALSAFFILACSSVQAGNYRRSEILAVINALQSQDSGERRQAAMKVAEMGPEAQEAVPALITALGDPDPGIKDEVATALGKIGPGAKAAVPALVVFLQDPNIGNVRSKAALALGYIGPDAVDAVPALIDTLNDRDIYMRGVAAMTLGDLASVAKSSIPKLISCLNTDDVYLRHNACCAILAIGLDANDLPLILPYLSDEIDCVRSCAARALGALGPQAAAAVPPLVKLTDDSSQYVRTDAITALRSIQPHRSWSVGAKQKNTTLDDYSKQTANAWLNTWSTMSSH